jgi:hypothetical protein
MTATKVVKSSQTITPFAGISFINGEIFRCGLSKMIDKQLSYLYFYANHFYDSVLQIKLPNDEQGYGLKFTSLAYQHIIF